MDDTTLVEPGQRTEIDQLADKVAEKLAAQGESLESMLYALRQQREHDDAAAYVRTAPAFYFGAIRMAPSRRITSPFSI